MQRRIFSVALLISIAVTSQYRASAQTNNQDQSDKPDWMSFYDVKYQRMPILKPGIERMQSVPGRVVDVTQMTDEPTYLNKLACKSDLVAIGTVTSSEAVATSERRHILTLSDVEVSNSLRGQRSPGALSVVRAGGTIVMDGQITRATDRGALTLTVGKEYLFFLTRVPGSQVYDATGDEAVFELNEQQYQLHSKQPKPFKEFVGARDKVNALVRNASCAEGDLR